MEVSGNDRADRQCEYHRAHTDGDAEQQPMINADPRYRFGGCWRPKQLE